MILAKIFFNIFILMSLVVFNISCLAMNSWGNADDDDTVNPAIIQQQLNDLQPFGVELKNNILHVSLKDDNPTDLGITLASSRELVAHYDAHLDYFTPLSRGHLRLLRCFPRLVSLKIHNQTLDASKGTILGEILNQHKSTLTDLDLCSTSGLKLTDDGLIAMQQGISTLSHIKMLTLNGQSNLSNNGKSTLSNILSNIVSIEELDLSNMNIGPQAENQVLGPCSKLTNLNKINVSNNNLGGDFLVSLKLLPSLIDLNLSKNQIIGKKLRCLPKFTSRNHLKFLNMAHNQIDDEGFNLISTLPNLIRLNVSSNSITDEGLYELSDLNYLIELDICYNRISENGAKLLTQQPQIELSIESLQEDPNSPTLNLNGKPIGPMEVLALANNKRLKTLGLQNSLIGAPGVQTLAQNTSLTSLNLEGNKAGDAGAQALAKNTTLTSLSIISNEIGDAGVQALANNTTIKSLILRNNQICPNGAQALGQNSTLTTLNLENNKVGKLGVQALAKNTYLKSLVLLENNIGDDDILTLAQNTTLTELNLGKNNIGIVWILGLIPNTSLTSLDLSNPCYHNIRDIKIQTLASSIRQNDYSNIVSHYRQPAKLLFSNDHTHRALASFTASAIGTSQTLAQAFLGLYYQKIWSLHNNCSAHYCDKTTNKPYHSHFLYQNYSHQERGRDGYLSSDEESSILEDLNNINNQVKLTGQNLEQNYRLQLQYIRAQALAQAVLASYGMGVQALTYYDHQSEYTAKVNCLAYTILDWYQKQLENVKLSDLIEKYKPQLEHIKTQNLDLSERSLFSSHVGRINDPLQYVKYVIAFYYGDSPKYTNFDQWGKPSDQHLLSEAILDIHDRQLADVRAEFLAQNATLTLLDLKGNNIGDVGAQALAKNTILRALNLENNKIGDSGAQALANNTTLNSLNLMGNPIGESGKNALRNNSVTRIKF